MLSGEWREAAADRAPTCPARHGLTARFDLPVPDNQLKLDAAEALTHKAPTRHAGSRSILTHR
jgi:hypothetical protein